jgi:HNH endonuclease/AP2 domain
MDIQYLKLTFNYNPDTGLLSWRVKSRSRHRDTVGTINSKGYLQVCLNRKSMLYHRICWTIYFNEQPPKYIDHINGNKLDNKILNLRKASHRLNNTNMPIHRSGRLPGAQYRKDSKKWRAVCKVGGKRVNIGQFDTEIEAHLAYIEHCTDNNLD